MVRRPDGGVYVVLQWAREIYKESPQRQKILPLLLAIMLQILRIIIGESEMINREISNYNYNISRLNKQRLEQKNNGKAPCVSLQLLD